MEDRELAALAVEALKKEYSESVCSLDEDGDAFHLLVSVRLSAQCTDQRVNKVTPALFAKYDTVDDFASADKDDVAQIIRSCGMYKTKSNDIVNAAKTVKEKFGGTVPGTMDELLSIPGVGRKTANLILGDYFKKPAIVTDTHFIRISNRLGLVKTKDPFKVEKIMKELIDPAESNDFCHRTVLHGRKVCTARKAYCENCVMSGFCRKAL